MKLEIMFWLTGWCGCVVLAQQVSVIYARGKELPVVAGFAPTYICLVMRQRADHTGVFMQEIVAAR